MPLPYDRIENPFENALKNNFSKATVLILLDDISSGTEDDVYIFFCRQGLSDKTNLSRLTTLLVSATTENLELIAEIIHAILSRLMDSEKLCCAISLVYSCLDEKISIGRFPEKKKFSMLISRYASGKDQKEKLTELLSFLIVLLLKHIPHLSPQALGILICRNTDIPRKIYHTFFDSLRELSYSQCSLFIYDFQESITPYLSSYLREAHINTLRDIQEKIPFEGALHAVINRLKFNNLIISRLTATRNQSLDFDSMILQIKDNRQSFFMWLKPLTPNEIVLLEKAKRCILAYQENRADFVLLRNDYSDARSKTDIINSKLQRLIDVVDYQIVPCIANNVSSGIVMRVG